MLCFVIHYPDIVIPRSFAIEPTRKGMELILPREMLREESLPGKKESNGFGTSDLRKIEFEEGALK